MSVEEVGEVLYSFHNLIHWTVPSFTLLSQKKSNRIWSPPFTHSGDYRSGISVLWVPEGFLGLMISSDDYKETPVKCVRFGIADINNSVISCCDGEWEEGYCPPSGHFKVAKFVYAKDLNSYWSFLRGKPQFRLFCEIVNNQDCKLIDASTQTDNSSGK